MSNDRDRGQEQEKRLRSYRGKLGHFRRVAEKCREGSETKEWVLGTVARYEALIEAESKTP